MGESSELDVERFWYAAWEVIRIYWHNKPRECAGDCHNETSHWGRFQGRDKSTRGFDVDAKVQVFESVIRGVGGLLSAHQFAIQMLPSLPEARRGKFSIHGEPFYFEYRDELLLLAEDLGRRILPALTLSDTGIPYPRINLRYGLPHGVKNPRYYTRSHSLPTYVRGETLEHQSERLWSNPHDIVREKPNEEITETCTAGAGSLVLEFTALSRLTGDPAYEKAAKRAFDAIWSRRSSIGLVGTGIDAETGLWQGANSGIGAGSDSFFEYAFKSYMLLAGEPDEGHFLEVWEQSRIALQRHVMVKEPATWWNNVHLNTGAGMPGSQWIDSLGGFWAGTLSGAGSLKEGEGGENDGLELATRTNLVYAALWARYSALPERFSTRVSEIESGLTWYPGRPEFIESTYLLYRATKDPFYQYVGEMVMRDLKRRCRSACGWAGLQDVRSGEQQDRMESFFLGETWTYLYLLFDDEHPLHKGDAPWVFTTEGHPLILPRVSDRTVSSKPLPPRTCLRPPPMNGIFSPIASRSDLFHASYFTRLHLAPHSTTVETSDPLIFSESPAWSPTNSTFYPWTLPMHVIPPQATCALLPVRDTLELIFPDGFSTPGSLKKQLSRFTPKVQRVAHGIQILTLDSLRLSLLQHATPGYMQISKVAGVQLGKDETVFIDREIIKDIVDVNFQAFKESEVLDLVVTYKAGSRKNVELEDMLAGVKIDLNGLQQKAATGRGALEDLLARFGIQFSELSSLSLPIPTATDASALTDIIPAAIAQGRGAKVPSDVTLTRIYIADSTACDSLLPRAAGTAEIVVLKRGECTFNQKLANVPDSSRLKLLLIEDVDGPGFENEVDDTKTMISPALDDAQRNAWGRERRHKVPMVMIRKGEVDWKAVEKVEVRLRWGVKVGGQTVTGLEIT